MDICIIPGMGPTCEAIAHYVHGGVTVFFLTWSFLLYEQRKQSNMMYMLFLNMLYFAFCNVKDLIFLVDGFWEDMFYSGISITIDLLYVPIMANFFIEVVSPGWVNLRRVLVPVVAQSMFIPLFIIFPSETMLKVALTAAYSGGVIAMILVCFLAVRHRKFIRENYSYTEHIDVSWTIRCGALLFICLTLYILAFSEETWLSGAVFQLICVGTWIYLYMLSRRHRVVDVPSYVFQFPWVKNAHAEKEADHYPKEAYDKLALRLESCMMQERMFLDPTLTLQDMASRIGTNRTYLSEYLNNILHKSFYEYINEWRVKEACRIMDDASGRRMTMQEVAEMSGFNSGSTFNRSFARVIGMTPSAYARKRG